MPRRACTSAAVAYGLALVATAPTCSHALVAPRHGLGRARAPIGRRRHRWAPALRRRGGGDDDDDDEEEDEEAAHGAAHVSDVADVRVHERDSGPYCADWERDMLPRCRSGAP